MIREERMNAIQREVLLVLSRDAMDHNEHLSDEDAQEAVEMGLEAYRLKRPYDGIDTVD